MAGEGLGTGASHEGLADLKVLVLHSVWAQYIDVGGSFEIRHALSSIPFIHPGQNVSRNTWHQLSQKGAEEMAPVTILNN